MDTTTTCPFLCFVIYAAALTTTLPGAKASSWFGAVFLYLALKEYDGCSEVVGYLRDRSNVQHGKGPLHPRLPLRGPNDICRGHMTVK